MCVSVCMGVNVCISVCVCFSVLVCLCVCELVCVLGSGLFSSLRIRVGLRGYRMRRVKSVWGRKGEPILSCPLLHE